MNPEGRKTPNIGSNIDERIRKGIEERDATKASLGKNAQTQQTKPNAGQTELQKKLDALKSQQKLNELKQRYPGLSPQNQTPNSPSASSGASPS